MSDIPEYNLFADSLARIKSERESQAARRDRPQDAPAIDRKARPVADANPHLVSHNTSVQKKDHQMPSTKGTSKETVNQANKIRRPPENGTVVWGAVDGVAQWIETSGCNGE